MIGKLAGVCAGRTQEGAVLLDVGGVGYEVRVPQETAILAKEGAPLQLFVHTVVREDAIDLYGFPAQEELSFFKMLTRVSGVGPKTALGILNIADTRALKRAIAAGDATLLTKVYGVGKKSAERVVVELKDKLAREVSADPRGSAQAVSADTEVLEALEALGYSSQESRRALEQVPADIAGVRERLSSSLRYLGTSPHKSP